LYDNEDVFSWRRAPGGIRALIKGVYDDIECPLSWESEHTLQAFQECILAGLAGTITVIRKEGREDIGELVRLIAKLDED